MCPVSPLSHKPDPFQAVARFAVVFFPVLNLQKIQTMEYTEVWLLRPPPPRRP